ncbi:hypothetical protein HCN44_010494 [Aphidius gifuensis]|uniref:Uncharacterized protein n=1 Tax=Aphidius gifuensis TaxID=684658 RepID=A0A834XQR5_APHGI|nr:17-beta-hydroxysteroid dehydrogenase 13-like [Aphidius gifuensis]KAF7991693.1 hypothetical protein HCN44_010494 [Aphidius gifuensis]
MISIREDSSLNSRITSPSSAAIFYLIIEFLIGLLISSSFELWKIIKYLFLPKPTRDLTDLTVLITGVTSSLGRCLAKEFANAGCKIICVDNDFELVRKIACELDVNGNSNLNGADIESVGPNHRKQINNNNRNTSCKIHNAYECNLWNKNSIINTAKCIKNDIGDIDILITCTGYHGQNIFDTVSKTLMSHYWTVIAFLPSMLKKNNAYVVGVTPTTSTKDAYMGTRAAVAGLMESLGQHFHTAGQINFLTIAPKADPRWIKQSEEKIAFDIVNAIKKNQSYLSWGSWLSAMIFSISCAFQRTISRVITIR